MIRPPKITQGVAVAALLTIAGLITAGAAYAYLTPVAVLTGTPDQSVPAAEGDVLAWARNSSTNTGGYNTYLRVGAGAIRQVNPVGTQAWPGGFDGQRLVFQQVTRGQSDIRFYNYVTHAYSSVPAGWNTKSWEWAPSVSGNYVLFGRKTFSTNRFVVLLGNLTTGSVQLMGFTTGSNSDAAPGQVNGNFATWALCPNLNTSCDVYEHNIATGVTSKVSNTFASGRFQYNPSVAGNGTVYFAHAQLACGASVTLNKRAIGSPRQTIAVMPSGIDIGSTYTDDSSGTPVVYFARYNCAQKQGDIYKVTD